MLQTRIVSSSRIGAIPFIYNLKICRDLIFSLRQLPFLKSQRRQISIPATLLVSRFTARLPQEHVD